MSGYDSFEEWVAETISQMDASEEQPEVTPSGRGSASCKIWVDVNGIMGDPGNEYTLTDLASYWEDNKSSDPVLAEYKGDWKAWLDDTIPQMEERIDDSLYEGVGDYEIKNVRGQLHAYKNGKFICSGDTLAELKKDLEEIESNIPVKHKFNLTWKVIESDDKVREKSMNDVEAENETEALKQITDQNAFEKKAAKVVIPTEEVNN